MRHDYMWLTAKQHILNAFPGCFDAYFENHNTYCAIDRLTRLHRQRVHQIEAAGIRIKHALIYCVKLVCDLGCGSIVPTHVSTNALTFSMECKHLSYKECLAEFSKVGLTLHFPGGSGELTLTIAGLLNVVHERILLGK